MKRKNATTSVARIAVVALCAVVLAVGLPACGRSSSSKSDSATSEVSSSAEVPTKTLTFAGFDFAIPDHWQGPSSKSTDTKKFFYIGTSNQPPLLMINSSEYKVDPSKTDYTDVLDDFQNGLINASSITNAKLISSTDITIAGLPGRVIQYTGTMSGMDLTLRVAFFIDTANDRITGIMMGEKSDAKTSYLSELDSIVSSITVSSQSSSTDSSSSTTTTKAPTTTTTTTTPTTTTTTNTSSETTYEDIYNEYAQKLQDATPGLIDEYNQEAAANTDGMTGLATICDKKISKLAAISTEGTEKMAQLMYTSGSGSYQDYEDWAMKLSDVYTTEAQKITDAYMDSAM